MTVVEQSFLNPRKKKTGQHRVEISAIIDSTVHIFHDTVPFKNLVSENKRRSPSISVPPPCRGGRGGRPWRTVSQWSG